ncbi:hypothetical protein BDZ88DRAFT_488746 [Geranomyces variabilis]|nr:hypothetical protein BDZ88DRAFT_488746 [Geranomyces variabilis]KAJ3135261.1 hypothetical protein HDU90_003984 [Geranomyces variabilis]
MFPRSYSRSALALPLATAPLSDQRSVHASQARGAVLAELSAIPFARVSADIGTSPRHGQRSCRVDSSPDIGYNSIPNSKGEHFGSPSSSNDLNRQYEEMQEMMEGLADTITTQSYHMDWHVPIKERKLSPYAGFPGTSQRSPMGNRVRPSKRVRRLEQSFGFSATNFKHENNDAETFGLTQPHVQPMSADTVLSDFDTQGVRPVPDIAFPPLDTIIDPIDNPHRKPYYRHPITQTYSPALGEISFRYAPAKRVVKRQSQPADHYASRSPATPTRLPEENVAGSVSWCPDSPTTAVNVRNIARPWDMNSRIGDLNTALPLSFSLPPEPDSPSGSLEIYARQLHRNVQQHQSDDELPPQTDQPFQHRPSTPNNNSYDPYDIPLSPSSLAALTALTDHTPVPDAFTHNGVLFRNSATDDALQPEDKITKKRSRDAMEMPYFYPSPPDEKRTRTC